MTNGLRCFIICVVVDVLALLFDAVLLLTGQMTITATVYAHPLLGAPLVAWNLWGAFCLFSHLYLERPERRKDPRW